MRELRPTALATMPTSWGAVTLTQAAQLAALGEGAHLQNMLAVLLDCGASQVPLLTPADLQVALTGSLFLAEPMPDYRAYDRPEAVRLGEVEVPVLDSLDLLTFGQAADIGAAMQQLGSSDVAALRLRVAAILLQPAYAGTAYDSDAVAALEPLVGGLTLAEALPLTDFFLPSTPASELNTTAGSNPFP